MGLASLAIIISATLWLGERAEDHIENVNDIRAERTAAVELRNALQTAESSQRGLLLSRNEIYLAPYDRAKDAVSRRLVFLQQSQQLARTSPQLLERLTKVVSEKLAEMDQTISLVNEGKEEDALRRFGSNRGKALMDEANVFLSGVIRRADDRLVESVDEQIANAKWLRWISILAAGAMRETG